MPNPSCNIVVLGGANSDYMVKGPVLPQAGQTIDGMQFSHAPGGKGANQAVAAARLGARVSFIGMVGLDDRGETLARAMQAEGVNTTWLYRTADAPTAAAIIMVNNAGQKQIMTAPGANRLLTPGHIRRAADVIRGADVLLLQLECPMETVMEAARVAHASTSGGRGGAGGGGASGGVKVVLDPAPPADVPDELLAMVDLLKPNSHEAEALTGQKANDLARARRAAEALMKRGVAAVVVQAGEEGNLAVWRGGEQFMPHLPVKVVDATGAGDAFAAAMSVAIAEGRDMPAIARFGHAAAAHATTKFGAQAGLPRRGDIESLLAV